MKARVGTADVSLECRRGSRSDSIRAAQCGSTTPEVPGGTELGSAQSPRLAALASPSSRSSSRYSAAYLRYHHASPGLTGSRFRLRPSGRMTSPTVRLRAQQRAARHPLVPYYSQRKEVCLDQTFAEVPNTPLNSGDNHRPGCRALTVIGNDLA